MLPKQRDSIPHEAHKEFVPCQTAIMIDVVEVKDTARFLRYQLCFAIQKPAAVSTYTTSNVSPTRGLISLHWYSLTSPYKPLWKSPATLNNQQLGTTDTPKACQPYRE